MDPFAKLNGHNRKLDSGEVNGLTPDLEEEWQRMYEFLNLTPTDFQAMLETVEVLFKRGHELVVGNYEYLLSNHETAAILGWERGVDEAHLAERRRFLTVWLARTLGFDLSPDFARYLFRAGQIHAAHGPRKTHVPELYVTGAISLVNATFARFLLEEMPGDPIVPTAMAAWNKILSMHLHMMISGYHTALALDSGDFAVEVSMFGKMRTITQQQNITMHLSKGARMETALQKFFNYFPQAREDVFDLTWLGGERLDASGTPWFVANKVYKIKPMWRVLVNGKDISYIGGQNITISQGDTISIFPPGR